MFWDQFVCWIFWILSLICFNGNISWHFGLNFVAPIFGGNIWEKYFLTFWARFCLRQFLVEAAATSEKMERVGQHATLYEDPHHHPHCHQHHQHWHVRFIIVIIIEQGNMSLIGRHVHEALFRQPWRSWTLMSEWGGCFWCFGFGEQLDNSNMHCRCTISEEECR